MKKNKFFSLLIGTLIYLAPQSQAKAQDDTVNFSLFLIGNVGKYDGTDPDEKRLLQELIDYKANAKGVIFLGNNFYPDFKDLFNDSYGDKQTKPQLEKLRDFDGPIGIVPGLADWAYGTANGKDLVHWEYESISRVLKGKELYMPDWGCPGPVEVPVNDSLCLVLIDTQWWMHSFDTRLTKCDMETKDELWANLRDVLRRNRHKQVLVAGYHPVKSYGEFGGHYNTLMSTLGFPISLYRKTLGTRADLANPVYSEFANELKTVLEEFPQLIYASSHERNFQYFTDKEVHYIIGGSLQGGRYIKQRALSCGSKEAGLVRIDFYRSGAVVLNFIEAGNPNTVSCAAKLTNGPVYAPAELEQARQANFPDSVLTVASTLYNIDEKKYKWVGQNYRQVWGQQVKVPVFDVETEKGGLTILKRGGGMQTKSLRLQAANKQQYGLRSIEKYVEGALPGDLKNTFAVDIAQDNISASNPYAAPVAARLANMAGVMHTNPELVYVPKDYRLGEYTEDLADKLFLFEERPAGNWSRTKSFGNSTNIVGTDEVLELREKSAEHQVDQQAVLRARIFDTFINDWDRHDDQWRWASFEEGSQTFYRPIPRDRDQAFYVNQGFLPWLATRKWLVPKFQNFAPKTENINGLTFNARYFDRSFLTEPNWNDWQTTLTSLMTELPDDSIRAAMRAFPKEVQALVGDSTARILLARKAYMPDMIRQHYLTLAKNVNVVGTGNDDRFEVKRLPNGQTEVSVWNKDKSICEYHRVFEAGETREIRLYGLGGDDHFDLQGEQAWGSIVRIIGGKGGDKVENQSDIKGARNFTHIYDNRKTQVSGTPDTREHLSANKEVNQYDRMDFRYDVVSPGLFLGYNPDDAVFIGGGPIFYEYKFRRHQVQTLMANFATLTGAFNARYTFESLTTTGGLEHHFGLDMKAPDYAMNYFGMGNKAEIEDNYKTDYYRLRINQFVGQYSVGKRWGKTAIHPSESGIVRECDLQAGLFVKRSDIEDESGQFIANPETAGLEPEDLLSHSYAGLRLGFNLRNLNKRSNPDRGYHLNLEARQFKRIASSQSENFTRLSGDLRNYISFSKNPRTVLVFRIGGEKLLGDHYFLESARLGGKTNLRGYRGDRFYGEASVYQNTELRYKLRNFNSYILNGEVGLLGFFDSGRVWLANEEADRWHRGYGAGFWLSPFGMTILTASYNWSKQDAMLQFSLNFRI
ncbi:MAG: BamA/TamA family outer membrane protein [Mangrovibacterium sp.]